MDKMSLTKTGSGVDGNQFHGKASTATQWENPINIDLRWSTGTHRSSDKNAGSINSLSKITLEIVYLLD